MDLCAVCQHWRRSATADPHDDPRFCPTQWVMLDDVVKHYFSRDYGRDDSRLFVHAATGWFLRKRLPLLRDYDLVTSTAGSLLVLAERAWAATPRTSVRVLNPFTGSMVHFAAPMPIRGPWRFTAAVVGSTSSPILVLVSIMSEGGPNKVYWADPCFSEGISLSKCPASSLPLIAADKCAAAGNNRHSGTEASKVFDLFGTDVRFRCYAVEVPGGDMLAVVKRRRGMDVLKVDAARKLTGLVRSIGNLALFLGVRCVAVDASMFWGIQANCAYFPMGMRTHDAFLELAIFKVDIGAEEQKLEFVEEAVPYDRPYAFWTPGPSYWSFNLTPFTLTQVLCNYTMAPYIHV